jgi:hypothetical protein
LADPSLARHGLDRSVGVAAPLGPQFGRRLRVGAVARDPSSVVPRPYAPTGGARGDAALFRDFCNRMQVVPFCAPFGGQPPGSEPPAGRFLKLSRAGDTAPPARKSAVVGTQSTVHPVWDIVDASIGRLHVQSCQKPSSDPQSRRTWRMRARSKCDCGSFFGT